MHIERIDRASSLHPDEVEDEDDDEAEDKKGHEWFFNGLRQYGGVDKAADADTLSNFAHIASFLYGNGKCNDTKNLDESCFGAENCDCNSSVPKKQIHCDPEKEANIPALQRLQNAAASSHVCFVAFSNHRDREKRYDVCGLLFISITTRYSSRYRPKSVQSGFLHTFGVAHSFRGGGIGKRLLKVALEWWDHTHSKKLSLTVKQGLDKKNGPSYLINEERAKRLQVLYKDHGFIVIKCDTVSEDYVYMERARQEAFPPFPPFPPLYNVVDS